MCLWLDLAEEIFEEIDIDCSDQISMGELKDALKAHKLRTFMNSLGISTEDVWTLFMCLPCTRVRQVS